jgi:hypothetical protein
MTLRSLSMASDTFDLFLSSIYSFEYGMNEPEPNRILRNLSSTVELYIYSNGTVYRTTPLALLNSNA